MGGRLHLEDVFIQEKQFGCDQCAPDQDAERAHRQSSQEAELFRRGFDLGLFLGLLDDELVVSDEDLLLLLLDGESVLERLLLLHRSLDLLLSVPLVLHELVLSLGRIFISAGLLSMESW